MIIIVSILFALLGLLSTLPMTAIMNRMPAKCFCDYDEQPEERHAPPRVSVLQMVICGILLAIIFMLLYLRFGLSVQGVFLCLFSVCLLMITLSDLRYCIIPDELIVVGVLLAGISSLPDVLSAPTLMQRLSPVFGALIGAGIIFVINLVGKLLYKKDSLGMGDLKLMAMCGFACGDVGIVMAVLIGFLSAGLFFMFGMLLKKVRSDQYLPLGPFLVFGVLFVCCLRPAVDALLAWYIGLL